MAKKSKTEHNQKRAKLAAQKAPKRARLRAIAKDRSLSVEERFDGDPEACRNAAQFLRQSRAQPLRGDGPSARL